MILNEKSVFLVALSIVYMVICLYIMIFYRKMLLKTVLPTIKLTHTVALSSSKNAIRDIFKIPDEMDERTRQLKKIHDSIYNMLDRLQNEGNCADKKFIRCQNIAMGGFGSAMHRTVICLQIALALNRAFLIDHAYKNFNGLAAFTELESSKCSKYIRENYSTIKENDRCDFKKPSCYTDGTNYEINNSYKLLEFTHEGIFPSPKYIPRTIPSNIEKSLQNLGIDTPWHWFTSQLLGYMISRPSKEFSNKYKEVMKNIGLDTSPIVGIYIRRGDKITEVPKFTPVKHFYDKAVEWSNENVKNGSKVTFFVMTTDIEVVEEMKNITSDKYKLIFSPAIENFDPTKPRNDFGKSVMQDVLIDLYILLHCDYSIVTYSSNIGRIVWELKTASFPYSADNSVVSMDSIMFYGWYAFDAHAKYHLCIRGNKKGYNIGNDEIVTYEQGQLHFFNKIQILTFKNGTTVQAAKIGIVHTEPVLGYALADDFIDWPGEVHYANDIDFVVSKP